MVDSYTKLLEQVSVLEDPSVAEETVAKLIVHLKSVGRIKMLSQIAMRLRKNISRRRLLEARVEVATEKESEAALRAAAHEGIRAHHAVVNPSLISGWRAREGGRLIDRSGKRALVRIYQKVTV